MKEREESIKVGNHRTQVMKGSETSQLERVHQESGQEKKRVVGGLTLRKYKKAFL